MNKEDVVDAQNMTRIRFAIAILDEYQFSTKYKRPYCDSRIREAKKDLAAAECQLVFDSNTKLGLKR